MEQAEGDEEDVAGDGQYTKGYHVLLRVTGKIEQASQETDDGRNINVHGLSSRS